VMSVESKIKIAKYATSAAELADSVKNDIVHGRDISDETILKLNRFIIASNDIEDFIKELKTKTNKYNN
jgi:hypothetical protein